MIAGRPGRWNLLNSRVILSTVLLGYGVVFTIRPHLPDILAGYSRFETVMPMWAWVVWSLLCSLGMLTAPRLSWWQRICQLGSSVYFFLVAGTIVAGVGLTPTVWTTIVEGLAGAAMFGHGTAEALSQSRIFQRLAAHPPGWFRGRRGRR